MNDYFDELEAGLRDAVRRQVHLPWRLRVLQVPLRHRGLAVVLAALVVATPAVAAVGAVAGWFSKGKPDVYYRGAAKIGVGKAIVGSHMLPIRVPDPDGGPPWGLRLVETSRGETCVQVGRVEAGKLVSLGIDDSWGNDHKYHAISPNDGVFDLCGATDAAGHGFVSAQEHGSPASAFAPSDSGSGKSGQYCQASNPISRLKARLRSIPKGSKTLREFRSFVNQVERNQKASKLKQCPAGSLRMISVGLLGPDAKTIAYKTPSGATRTEDTVGGVGAYLIVFKQTAANCNDFTTTLDSGGGNGCSANYGATDETDLQGPNAVVSVTYADGKTCSDVPSAEFAAAYKAFTKRISGQEQHKPAEWIRQQFAAFMVSQHMAGTNWIAAADPRCPPVGWVSETQAKPTAKQVTAPIKLTVVSATRYCTNGPKDQPYKGNIIACDNGVPAGYSVFPSGHSSDVWVTASFIARQPVTKDSSFYEFMVTTPSGDGEGTQTNYDIRRGQRVKFGMFVDKGGRGIYRGAIGFMANTGLNGVNGGDDQPGHDGSILVGQLSFRVPHAK